MNSAIFINYLLPYGAPVIITAICVSLLSYLLKKFLPENFAVFIKIYFPFLAGIVLYFVYDAIFISHAICFSQETISMGVLSGTLSTVIFAFIKNLKNGNVITDQVILAIEGILCDTVEKTVLLDLANKIKELFTTEQAEEQLVFLIAEEIVKASKNDDLLTALPLATLIVDSVKSLEKPN